MTRYIALPMGEASGVSPEMIIKALQSENHRRYGGVIVIGDLDLFKKVSRDLLLPLPFSAYVIYVLYVNVILSISQYIRLL